MGKLQCLTKTLPSVFKDNDHPAVSDFDQRYDDCDSHGRYKANFMYEGREVWRGNCPTCRAEALNRNLVAQVGVPKLFKFCEFENYETSSDYQLKIKTACENYADSFVADISVSPSVIMLGLPGTGKNHLITAIIKKISKKQNTAAYIQAVDYLDKYWDLGFSERKPWLHALSNIDFLVIDEIGRSSNSKSANDAMFRIINNRYLNMKPTALISNLQKEDFINEIGVATYDRLKQFDGIGMVFNWESYR